MRILIIEDELKIAKVYWYIKLLKDISISMFKIKTIKDNQEIQIKCFNEIADYFYSKYKKGNVVMIEGKLEENEVIVTQL